MLYRSRTSGKKVVSPDADENSWRQYILASSPISVYKKDTLYSASDGAFFYYKGVFNRNNDLLTMNFTEISWVVKSPSNKSVRAFCTLRYNLSIREYGHTFVIRGKAVPGYAGYYQIV